MRSLRVSSMWRGKWLRRCLSESLLWSKPESIPTVRTSALRRRASPLSGWLPSCSATVGRMVAEHTACARNHNSCCYMIAYLRAAQRGDDHCDAVRDPQSASPQATHAAHVVSHQNTSQSYSSSTSVQPRQRMTCGSSVPCMVVLKRMPARFGLLFLVGESMLGRLHSRQLGRLHSRQADPQICSGRVQDLE